MCEDRENGFEWTTSNLHYTLGLSNFIVPAYVHQEIHTRKLLGTQFIRGKKQETGQMSNLVEQKNKSCGIFIYKSKNEQIVAAQLERCC